MGQSVEFPDLIGNKMQHRDLLKDQIEQLGKALAKIMADFLGQKTQGEALRGIEAANKQLQSQLDLDIDKLSVLTKGELKTHLTKKHFTAPQLELLAEFFKEAGGVELNKNSEMAKARLTKARELLNIADEISGALSLDRVQKLNEIEELLKEVSGNPNHK